MTIPASGEADEKWEGDGDFSYTFFHTEASLGGTVKIFYGNNQSKVKASGRAACSFEGMPVTASTSCDDLDSDGKRNWTVTNPNDKPVFVQFNQVDKWMELEAGSSTPFRARGEVLSVHAYGAQSQTFDAPGCDPIQADIYVMDAQDGSPSGTVYAVELNEENRTAQLEKIFTIQEHAGHIAVNNANTMMYIVGGNNFLVYDLVARHLTKVSDFSVDEIIHASMNLQGELWVASKATDLVYQVDKESGNILQTLDPGINISHGDLVFTSESAYLVGHREIHEIDLSTGETSKVNDLRQGVNGMAVLEDGLGDIIFATHSQDQFFTLDPATGIETGYFKAFYDGKSFTFGWGDMATAQLRVPFNPCQVYLADKDRQQIFTVTAMGGDAVTTPLLDYPYENTDIHIALDPTGEKLFAVVSNGQNKYGYYDLTDFTYHEMGRFRAGKITQITFSPAGELYLSENKSNELFRVTDLELGAYESMGRIKIDETDQYVDLKGADIAFDQDGSFYVGTHASNGQIYTVSGLKDYLIAVPLAKTGKAITGIAVNGDGNLWVSNYRTDYLVEVDVRNGSKQTLNLSGALEGKTGWGDMSSACFEVIDLCAGYASEVIAYNPGTLATGNGTPVNERMVAENALGAPQENDLINFVSLGFGGELVLALASPVYNHNKNGIYVDNENSINYGEKSYADFIIVETSFGRREQNCGPNKDKNYPEKLLVYGKQNLDDNEWVLLSEPEGECRSSFIDVQAAVDAGLSYVKYLKLVDVSDPKYFPASGDGFDVDGIIICPDQVVSAIAGEGRQSIANARYANAPEVFTETFLNKAPNEAFAGEMPGVEFSVYPNPSAGQITIQNGADMPGRMFIYDLSGSLIQSGVLESGASQAVDLSGMQTGLYLVELKVGDRSSVQRVQVR
jgi:hypothetical protein